MHNFIEFLLTVHVIFLLHNLLLLTTIHRIGKAASEGRELSPEKESKVIRYKGINVII